MAMRPFRKREMGDSSAPAGSFAFVAQLEERSLGMREVAGSTPADGSGLVSSGSTGFDMGFETRECALRVVGRPGYQANQQ